MKFFHLKFFLGFLSFCFGFSPLFAENLSLGEKNALSYIRNVSFEVARFNITGISSLPEAASLSALSRSGTNVLSRHSIFRLGESPVYLFEYYNPEKTGIIDSTFCPEDLYMTSVSPMSSGESESFIIEEDWIDLLLRGLAPESGSESGILDLNDGSKILEMLEGSDDRGIEGLEDSKIEDDLPQEFSYIKNDGSLRRFSYDGEQFSVWNEGEYTVLANFYGNKLIRKHFDSLFRLVKNEVFRTASQARNMSAETIIDYDYPGNSSLPEKSVEELISEKKRIENHFDEKGRNILKIEGHYEEKDDKSSKDKKKSDSLKEMILLNDKNTSKQYDSEGRLTMEEFTLWSYRTNSFGKTVKEERKLRNEYDYSSVSDVGQMKPDLKYYENGELHLFRKYISADSYSEKLYFDGGFSVEVIYVNGVKKTEIIYMNDVEKRRRNFEY